MEIPAIYLVFDYSYQTHFMKLSVKWHKYIFSFLSQKSRQMIRSVCRQWKRVVDDMPCAVVNNKNYQRTTQLTNLYFVKVQNFTTELQTGIEFKHTIRRFVFWDVVVSYNLFHLLQECPGVRELIFGNVTLDSHKKMRFPQGLALPEVKVISFHTKSYVGFTVHELILLDFLRQIKFGKLEEVMTDENSSMLGYAARWEVDNIELPRGINSSGLVEFLAENGSTVKKLKTESRQFRPFGCQIEEIRDQIGQLQFEEMKCSVWGEGESQVIEQQKKLKEIYIECRDDCWLALATAIQASASTLTKAAIVIYFEVEWMNQNPPQWQTKDASIFRDCSKLESLHLHTGTSILNLYFLPDSIQSLSLEAQFTSDQDLLGIASKLRNLREVDLQQLVINFEESMLFSNEIIEAFLGIETLESLFALDFRRNAEDIAIVEKSQGGFHFFNVLYGNSVTALRIRKKLTPVIIPIHQ